MWAWPACLPLKCSLGQIFLCGGQAGIPPGGVYCRSITEASRTVSCLVGREGQTHHESHPGLSAGRPQEPGFIFLSHHSPETHVPVFLAASFFDFQSHQLQAATNNFMFEMPALCLPVAHKAREVAALPLIQETPEKGWREAPREGSGQWRGSIPAR